MFFPIVISKKMQFALSNYPLDLKTKIQTMFYEKILKSKAEDVNIIDDSIVFKRRDF